MSDLSNSEHLLGKIALMCVTRSRTAFIKSACFVVQLASRGTRFAVHTSSTAPVFPGWTQGKQPCPLPTTTTHGRWATSANPACTPPAPATPAAAAPARLPCRRSPQRPTPARTSTASPLPPRKTCLQTPAQPPRHPPQPGWTRRSRSNTRCRWRTVWKWRAAARSAAAWPRWTARRPRITPSRPTRPILCLHPTSTAAASSTPAACSADPPPALRPNAKAKPGRAQVSESSRDRSKRIIKRLWFFHMSDEASHLWLH